MATVHISAVEAERDFAALLARVRAGVDVVIEDDKSASFILRKADEPKVRLLSESLRLAKEHGSMATLDDEFGRDLEAIVESHSEPLTNLWD